MQSDFVPRGLVGRAMDAAETIINRRSLPNAMIIQCEDENSASKCARFIAAGVACLSESKRPCGVCDHCRRIFNNIEQDVIDIFPQEGRQAINVDEAREVRADAFIVPGELDFKTYILHNTDKMMAPAQNALLKVLEEPPRSAHFILLCSNAAALLPTVRSRCWQINVLTDGKNKKESKLDVLARDIVHILADGNRSDFAALLGRVPEDRNDFRGFVRILLCAFRDIYAEKNSRCGDVWFNDRTEAAELARKFSEAGLLRAYDHVYEIMVANDANTNILASRTLLLGGLWNCINN